MRIWVDLANAPHVPLFAPLIADLAAQGHEVLLTARDLAETTALCQTHQLDALRIDGYGGRALWRKGLTLLTRAAALVAFGRTRAFDLCVSHNSYALAVAARALGVPHATLMDYEHQPANHLSFRLATRVIVPESFDPAALRRHGASPKRVARYSGYKEDIYLADFAPRADFLSELVREFAEQQIDFDPKRHVLVTLRLPPDAALYHRFDNPLLAALWPMLCRPQLRVVVLARGAADPAIPRLPGLCALRPSRPLPGAELIAASDWLLSAGGTMAREAAVLGVPAVSLFWGRQGGVDRSLAAAGRLRLVRTAAELAALSWRKRGPAFPRRARHVRAEVLTLALGAVDAARHR